MNKKLISSIFKRMTITFLLLVAVLFPAYVGTALYIGTNVYKDNKIRSDVIIVLGAKSFKNGDISECLRVRVDQGITLLKEGYAPKILFSGGADIEDGAIESQTMSDYAIKQGVSKDQIIQENKSTSTIQNLQFSKNIMGSNEYKSAIIVTEVYHSPRADFIAHSLGINHTVSPTDKSTCWTAGRFLSFQFLREPIALWSTWFTLLLNKN